METVGIRELRQNLSVYVRRVAAGEAFDVTDRGRRVAMLVPAPDAADPLADLVASGRVVPARRRGLDGLPAPLPAVEVGAVTAALDDLRGERLP